MNTSFTPSPVSALALTRRQLADWQQLHANLTLQNADARELNYAQSQIDYLESEVKALQYDADRRAASSTSSTSNGDAQ